MNIKGKIVAAPCQISSDSVARTISLTDSQGIRASSLYTPGSATEWVPFDNRAAANNAPLVLGDNHYFAIRLERELMLMKKEVNGLSPPGIFLYHDAF